MCEGEAELRYGKQGGSEALRKGQTEDWIERKGERMKGRGRRREGSIVCVEREK